jgi:hypothetical protein
MSAADVVSQLMSDGNVVIVNKPGAQPLNSCTVRQVRPGQSFTQVISMTVYVDVNC